MSSRQLGLRAALRWVIGIYRVVASALLITGCGGQLLLIILRNLVSVEPAWSEEAVTVCLAVGGLLFIGLCPRHIAFEALGERLISCSPAARVLRDLLGVAVCIAMTYAGIKAMLQQKELSATFQSLDVQVWIAMLSIPIAFGALALRYFAEAWLLLLELFRPAQGEAR